MTKQDKDKLDFVDATIHELKTSLTAIIVSAELLADELQPDEKSVLGRLIQSIIRNAHSIDERLSFLSETEELLTENARFQPEPVEVVPIEPVEVVEPTPVEPTLVEPPPVESAPVVPPPIEPEAVEPAPVEPVAVEPTPEPTPTVEEPAPSPPIEKATEPLQILDHARQALAADDIDQAATGYRRLIKKKVELEKVIEDLRTALERDPKRPDLWQVLGDAYMENDQLTEAIDAYKRGMEAA